MKKFLTFGFGILGSLLFAGCGGQGAQDAALKAEFLNPGTAHRMNINRHGVPQDEKGQDEMLQYIVDNGYRGMTCNVDWKDYLKSPEQWELYRKMVYKAKDKGLDMWIYDENMYPSGMAYPYILEEHPEWESEGLYFWTGDFKKGDRITVPEMPGKFVTGNIVVKEDGKADIGNKSYLHAVSFDRPGKVDLGLANADVTVMVIKHAPLYEGFQAGTERGGIRPRYTSLLMPEVTKRFIELTHHAYANAFDEKLGDIFTSTFTDEPSSMAMAFVNLGMGVLPWKENVSAEFEKRTGTKLEDKLLAIMLDEGADGEKARFDYFTIVSDFMSQHYFKQIRDFCQTENLPSGGHLLVEECMMAQATLYGDIMACFREMDIPGIDVLVGMPKYTRRYLYSSRLAASASELIGGTRVMSEPCPIHDYTEYDGKEAPADQQRGTLNRQIVGGVTDFNNYLQLQHEDEAGRTKFNEYIARVTMMMQGGHRASRIAVYYPMQTLWTKFRPEPTYLHNWDLMDGGTEEAQHVARLFDRVSDCMYDNGWEFSYIDDKGLTESVVDNGKLAHGELAWDVVVLPAAEAISEAALSRLSEFAQAGGKVIFVEGTPENSFTEFPSEANRQLYAQMKDIKTTEGDAAVFSVDKLDQAQLSGMLEGLIDRDIVLEKYDGVLHSHKKIDGRDVYLILNDTPEPVEFAAEFPLAKKLELWNPHTGEVTALNTGGSLSFEPWGSLIVRQIK